jgi:hypothetical protein
MTDTDPEAGFEAIDHDEAPGVGPAAVLLCGFAAEEVAPLERLLAAAGAPEHAVILASEPMLDLTLQEALCTGEPGPPLAAHKLPRTVILSGLNGSQLHRVIDGFAGTGLAPPIWASTTPGNLSFTVRDLLRELLAEQRAMASRDTSPAQGR